MPMDPADEAAKIEPTEGQSPGAAAGSDDQLEEQLRDTLKELQRPSHQSKPAEDLHGSDHRLDEQLRVSVEALLHPSPPSIPAEEVDDLLLAIRHHLDQETSERKAIYNRLAAIESEIKRRSRGLARYLVAICIGVAAIVAWQSYAESAKQMIATSAPKLGWSPEAKQMTASWVERLGWTKQPAGPESTAVQPPAPQSLASMPAAPYPDLQQIQQIEADMAAVRQAVDRQLADVRSTVEQIAASQDQMMREVDRLQAADEEILAKIPAPPPQRPAAPVRKPTPIARPSPRAPIPPHLPPRP
jgi:hypothetical protein